MKQRLGHSRQQRAALDPRENRRGQKVHAELLETRQGTSRDVVMLDAAVEKFFRTKVEQIDFTSWTKIPSCLC